MTTGKKRFPPRLKGHAFVKWTNRPRVLGIFLSRVMFTESKVSTRSVCNIAKKFEHFIATNARNTNHKFDFGVHILTSSVPRRKWPTFVIYLSNHQKSYPTTNMYSLGRSYLATPRENFWNFATTIFVRSSKIFSFFHFFWISKTRKQKHNLKKWKWFASNGRLAP